MSNLGTVRNQILSNLNRTSPNDLTASCETAIRTAIEYYGKAERFRFLEGQATTETIVGQAFYVLPDDFRDDDSLVITANGITSPLERRLYNQIEASFSSPSYTGIPCEYAIYDQQIRLYPTPDAQYTIKLSYFKKLAELTQEEHTNDWMTEGRGLIEARAEWQLLVMKLRDYDAAAACRETAGEELKEHRKNARLVMITGHTRKRKM